MIFRTGWRCARSCRKRTRTRTQAAKKSRATPQRPCDRPILASNGNAGSGYCWHDYARACESLAEIAQALRASLEYDDCEVPACTAASVNLLIEEVISNLHMVFEMDPADGGVAALPHGWLEHVRELLRIWLT